MLMQLFLYTTGVRQRGPHCFNTRVPPPKKSGLGWCLPQPSPTAALPDCVSQLIGEPQQAPSSSAECHTEDFSVSVSIAAETNELFERAALLSAIKMSAIPITFRQAAITMPV